MLPLLGIKIKGWSKGGRLTSFGEIAFVKYEVDINALFYMLYYKTF